MGPNNVIDAPDKVIERNYVGFDKIPIIICWKIFPHE